MARRGFGGTALRAALGAVTGVAEGMQQREVVAEQRRKDAEEAMFRRITAGILPVEDVLPQEQGKIGPLATSPAAMSSAPTPPATLGQMIAQRTQAPVGGSGPMAPSAFGASAAAPPRTVSNVQRVMDEFSSRAPKTFREGTQRYALPRTDEERTMLSIALQQAAGQDTTAGNEAAIEKQAQAYASLVGGDMNKARLLARGALPGMLGVETTSPLERRVSEANIRQSDAAAAASRAAGDAARDTKSGKMTERDINEQIARYMQQDVILKDDSGQETRRQKTEEEIRTFAATLRAIVNTPTEFPSFENWSRSGMNPFPNTAPKK